MPPTHLYHLLVPPSSIDANGHANNVEFVRWMQDAAVSHADAVGGTAATLDAGASWVVRAHRIEYRRPALLGERLVIKTWVENFRRAFSLRKYEFRRPADDALLATAETDWVFVDTATGRPRTIPPHIVALFGLSPRDH